MRACQGGASVQNKKKGCKPADGRISRWSNPVFRIPRVLFGSEPPKFPPPGRGSVARYQRTRSKKRSPKLWPAPFAAGPHLSVLANANKPPPGTTTCAGRPSFARGGGSRRQLDLSAHTWRWARRGKKRREMPHVHQGSYGPPGADNMPRTAGAKRPTAAFARLRRERPQRRNRSARRCARRMRSSLNLSFAQPGASPAL